MRVPWGHQDWRRVAVYGLGISGRAAASLLCSRGVAVLGVDDRPRQQLDVEELERLGVELRLGDEAAAATGHDGVGLDGVGLDGVGLDGVGLDGVGLDGVGLDGVGLDGVVVSPGVPPDRPLLAAARARGLPIIAEVELAFHFLDGEVVGITGSNGKSTTTALTGAMLEAAGRRVEVCGNIGAALSSRVEGEPGRVFVVELSSYQLESVDTFHPRSAALLNLSQDHLDRHGDLESYLAAKTTIFSRQSTGDLAVLNAADPLVAATRVSSRRRFFSSEGKTLDGCYLDGDLVVEVSPESEPSPLFHRSSVPLPGSHNLENAMAAALLARAHGAAPHDVEAGMKDFRGLPHRLERVAELGGVAWYDDSKGTNLAATERSLEGFDDGCVLVILGGRSKGGDLTRLRALLKRKARRIYLIGEAAPELARGLAPDFSFESVGTLERAVARAAGDAGSGDVVLLSPACSSFDQFDNFAQRGRVFQRLVKALPGGNLGS